MMTFVNQTNVGRKVEVFIVAFVFLNKKIYYLYTGVMLGFFFFLKNRCLGNYCNYYCLLFLYLNKRKYKESMIKC